MLLRTDLLDVYWYVEVVQDVINHTSSPDETLQDDTAAVPGVELQMICIQ